MHENPTKFVLGLHSFVCLNKGSTANPVPCTDSKQVKAVLLQSGHCVLCAFGMVGDQSPCLALLVAPLHDISDYFTAAVILWFLPRQTDLTVSGVNHLQVLHRSRYI